jgi:acetylornithine deacetylase/succinyl-diaminopimelate desuccinylase-like protein
VFAATADEEVGAGFGLEWLVEAHPDLIRLDYAVNEGGGDRIVLGESVYYGCGVAEKTCAPFRLRVRGRSGHASVPGIAENALVKAAPLIAALGTLRPEPVLIPEVRRFFEVALGEVPAPEEAHARAHRELGPAAAELVEPLLAPTFSPTMIEAARVFNVVPGACEVTVDCRLLPGQRPADVDPLLRSVLGEDGWELDWIDEVGGTRSTLDGPLWATLEEWVGRVEPGARLLPTCNPGFTDSHFLRQAFETTAYGFFPLRAMDAELASRLEHSADERAAVDDLELGVDALRHVALSLL